MEQIGIALFGVTAVFLSMSPDISRRRWAPILGLCGQPFWAYTAYTNEQWGIMVLVVLYTWSWARGLSMWRKK